MPSLATSPKRGSTLTKDESKVDSGKLAQRIAALGIEKGAENVVILDMRGVVSYTDFFVIMSGRNERQSKAIHDEIHVKLKAEGRLIPAHTEGLPEARWILLDYVDAVVHIFTPATRDFYRLEQLWGEVPAETVTA